MSRIFGWFLMALSVVIAALSIGVLLSNHSHSSEKGYQSPHEQTIRQLISQEITLDEQLHDRSVLIAQRKATVREACDLIVGVNKPSADIVAWSQVHCNQTTKGES